MLAFGLGGVVVGGAVVWFAKPKLQEWFAAAKTKVIG